MFKNKFESIKTLHQEDVKNSEDESVKYRQRKLESVFSRGEEKLLNEETVRQLKLFDLVEFLLRKNKYTSEDDDEAHMDLRSIQEIFEESTTDIEAIKMRQDLLGDLVQGREKNKEKVENKLKEMKKLTDRLHSIFTISLDKSVSERGDIENNIDFFKHHLNGSVLSEFDQDLKFFLTKFTGKSNFFNQLKANFKEARPALKKYVDLLGKSGMQEQFQLMLDYYKSGNKKDFNKLKIKDGDEYRRKMDELSERGKELDKLAACLGNLSGLLSFAEMIVKHDLRKMEITDDNVVELKGVCNPFLIRKLGEENVVPADVSLSEQKSNLIITGDNATGKTALVDDVILNVPIIQTIWIWLRKRRKVLPAP